MLKGLPQGLQRLAAELRQLIEEEDAVMGQAYLARTRVATATDHALGARAAVRASEGTLLEQFSDWLFGDQGVGSS